MTKDQQNLISKNIKLMHFFINRKVDDIPYHLRDDFFSDIALRFCNSAIKFDKTKGFQFSTYAYGGFHMCCMDIETRKRPSYQKNNFIPQVLIENIIEDTSTITEHVEEEFLQDIIDKARLSKREMMILQSYYFDGNSMAAIGEECHISRGRVSQIVKDILRKIRQVICSRKLSLADFYEHHIG